MIRQAQLPRGEEDQEFRVLKRIFPPAERVATGKSCDCVSHAVCGPQGQAAGSTPPGAVNTANCLRHSTQPHFRIDHVIARQHGGKTELENLALACIHCNRFKRPNIASFDAQSGTIVRLFHPRHERWMEHFKWDGPELKALTQIGRVTIAVLLINDPETVAVRKALQNEGVF